MLSFRADQVDFDGGISAAKVDGVVVLNGVIRRIRGGIIVIVHTTNMPTCFLDGLEYHVDIHLFE
jgi:hypothetical protein